MEYASPTPVWGRQLPGECFEHRFTEDPSWSSGLGASTMFCVILISLMLHFVQWSSHLAASKCLREETARANTERFRADAEKLRAEAAIDEASRMSESKKQEVRNATNSLRDALEREECLKIDLNVSKVLANRCLRDYNELMERYVLQGRRESDLRSRVDELQNKTLSLKNDVAVAQEVNISTLRELESSQAGAEAARQKHKSDLRKHKAELERAGNAAAKAQLEKYDLLAPVLETRERGRKCGKEAALKASLALPQLFENNKDCVDANTQTSSLVCEHQTATFERQTDSSIIKLLEERDVNICNLKEALSQATITAELEKSDASDKMANLEARRKNLERALESSRADNKKLTAQLNNEIEARTEATSNAIATSKQLESLSNLNADLQEKLTISNNALAAAKQTAVQTKAIFADAGTQAPICDLQTATAETATAECQTDSSFAKLLEEISSTKRQIASMEIAGKNLEHSLESSRADNEKLTAQLSSATLAARSTSKQLETLNSLNLDLQEKLTISNNSLAVAKQTSIDAENSQYSSTRELLAARAELATTRQAYESRISGQEVSLQQSRDIINKLNLDNASLRQSTSALQEDLALTKQSADRFAGETSMLRDQLAATTQALNLKSQEIDDAGKTVEMLKARISIIEEELRAAMDGNLALKNAAEQAKLDKQRAQEEVDRARVEAQQEYLRQIQQREAALTCAAQEVESLRQQLAGTTSQFEMLQKEFSRVSERAERDVADLAEKLLAAEGENADYQEEAEDARDAEVAWRRNYIEAAQKLADIEKELQVVKDDRDGLRKQCMELEDSADDLESKVESLESKVASLAEDCDELRRERDELDELVDLVQEENESYRKTVERLEGRQNLKSSKLVPKDGAGLMPGGPTPSPEPQNGSGSAASIPQPRSVVPQTPAAPQPLPSAPPPSMSAARIFRKLAEPRRTQRPTTAAATGPSTFPATSNTTTPADGPSSAQTDAVQNSTTATSAITEPMDHAFANVEPRAS
ncbi:hypothetical protein HDU96_001507 [Phlyctochytrium bullatum]|nr:hypothetical protein HDU96_001507 [Phlyctochytrium bullatum]